MTIRELGQAISKFFEALGQGVAKAWDRFLDIDLGSLGWVLLGLVGIVILYYMFALVLGLVGLIADKIFGPDDGRMYRWGRRVGRLIRKRP